MKADEKLLRVAEWYHNLRERNNDAFMPLFADKHRYLVLKGGGGSGKSIWAGQKVLERCTGEKGHRWLVCRKVAKTLRESCFAQLRSQAYEFYADMVDYIPKGKGGDMYIRFKNGSEIIFAGLDDVEKLKSIYNITGIWIEEATELEEGDFNQLDIRLRTEFPHYLQMIITFNPVSATHWLKKRFFDFDIPDPEERKLAMERTRVHESTYKDNRFLTKEAIRTLEGFRLVDEYYYTVYALGMWGTTGKSVFDNRLIARRLGILPKPVAVGYYEFDYDGLRITNIRWVDDPTGFITLWRKPEQGVPYVIGGDTAGDGSDSFAAHIIDNTTGEQVGVLWHRFDEDLYSRQVYCMGMRYNTALVGIETNFSTYPVMELERLGYPNQYVRETVDSYTHKVQKRYGFNTNTKTRPIIISELIQSTRESEMDLINHKGTLEEMQTFVRSESWKPEAEDGAHDDLVLSLAITNHIRPQQSYLRELPPEEEVEWSKSQWEDYRKADKVTREYLIQKWGRPRRK